MREGDRLVCPACPWDMEVSTEDPDASLSQMYNHLYWDHALPENAVKRELAQAMKLVDAAGREVQS